MKPVFRFIASAIIAAGISSVSHAASITDIEIVNRTTGEHLPTYRHDGQLWIAGKPGDRYAIRVINRTGARMLTVVSVDGINVVSGETAAQNQRGYVLSPSGFVEIAGWRKSERDVAAFYFTAVEDSYAGRTGRPDNVGVIGVAAFHEYQRLTRQPRPRLSAGWVPAMVSGFIRQRNRLISSGRAMRRMTPSRSATTLMPGSLHAESFLRPGATSRRMPSRAITCRTHPDCWQRSRV